MGDSITISISDDSRLDETHNQDPWRFSLEATYEFPFEIDIVQFPFFFLLDI